MRNNFILETEEVQRILSLHETLKKKTLKEQSTPKTSKVRNRQELIDFFANAKAYGCLLDVNLIYDKPFRIAGEDRGYIKGPSQSMKGKDKRVYDDFTFEIVEPSTGAVLKSGQWVCKQLEPKVEPEKPNVLNTDQEDVLKRISQDRWAATPKPSQVALDKGEFESSDLTDPQSTLGATYSRYFPKEQFPKGYFVYRKVVATPQVPSKPQEIVIDGDKCKVSIEALYNHMNKPNRFPLSKAEKDGHVRIAQVCAEKKNLLRFSMNKQLKDIASTYGIKIQ